MNKLIFKKFLTDFLFFFAITIVSASIIVWVFQAVNFLDIMVEDGKSYFTYINYTLLNLPKIITKLFPFILFFSFFYVLNRYEASNELLIFWNFGVNKIKLIYLFFYLSIILTIIQILFTTFIVPNSLSLSRELMKNSNIDLFDGFIKPKKFNDTIKGLTIYSEDKKENGDLSDIFIKKETGENSFQITYAKTGKLKIGSSNILELYNGETINNINGKVSKFKFQKSDFSLNDAESDVIDVNKLQETPTLILLSCINRIFDKDIFFLNQIDIGLHSHNCSKSSLENIFKELYKRFLIPFYIPVLFLVTLNQIFKSKEEKYFFETKFIIFLTNFFIIVFSETTIRFISDVMSNNYLFLLTPFVLIFILLFNFILQFKIKYNKPDNRKIIS